MNSNANNSNINLSNTNNHSSTPRSANPSSFTSSNPSTNTNPSSSNPSTRSNPSSPGSSTNPGSSKFIALDVSYRLIEALAMIVPVVERHDRDLANQLRRAATSISLKLAEGSRSQKGNRQKHFALALGSASEVKAALCVARAWGWIDGGEHALGVLDRLLALLWRLTR